MKMALFVVVLLIVLPTVGLYYVMGWLGAVLGFVLGLAAGIGFLLLMVRRILANRQEDDGGLVSIVLLLKAPCDVSGEEVHERAKRALGIDNLEVHGPFEYPEKLGRGNGFGVIKDGIAMSINCPRVRYTESGATFDDSTPPELQEILKAHGGWVGFDFHAGEDSPDVGEDVIFAHLGRLAAEFADGNTLAVYTPTFYLYSVWKEELREILRSWEPLKVFGPGPYIRPDQSVIRMDARNEKLNTAMQEARDKFPDFQGAFITATEEERGDFLAKMAFTDGEEVEHMWIRVEAIEGEMIKGVLLNSPNDLTNVSEGDKVALPLAQLSDWAYPKGDSMRGNFTHEILMGR